MANYLYNGVELPDINTVWTDKETYPHSYIKLVDGGYELWMLSNPYYVSDSGVLAVTHDGTWTFAFCMYVDEEMAAEAGLDTACWMQLGASTGENTETAFNKNVLVWSNTDILNADGTVYLAASDPVPVGGSKLTISTGGSANGDGMALYNGVMLPNIDSVWDKSKYPYAFIEEYDFSPYGVNARFYGLTVADRVVVFDNSYFKLPGLVHYSSFTCVPTQEDLDVLSAAGMPLPSYGNWITDTVDDEVEAGDTEYGRWLDVNTGEPQYLLWVSNDVISTADSSVKFAASAPIPLDGMNVITWDGDTTGLESVESTWFKVSDEVVDKETAQSGIVLGSDNTISDTGTHFDLGDNVLALEGGTVLLVSSDGASMQDLTIAHKGIYFVKVEGAVYTSLFAYPASSGGVTDTTATVNFSCKDLLYTDSVYRIKAWVYKVADGLDVALTPTWTSDLFAGPSHSESHTFTGLTPATEYGIYAVIWSETDGAATEHNATATFTTLEGEAPTGTIQFGAVNITGTGFTAVIEASGLDDATAYTAEIVVYNTATSAVAAEAVRSFTGNYTMAIDFAGLTPETDYTVAVDVYPTDTGKVVARGEFPVATGQEEPKTSWRDSFLLGFASGLGCTAATKTDADHNAWMQGYIVGDALRAAITTQQGFQYEVPDLQATVRMVAECFTESGDTLLFNAHNGSMILGVSTQNEATFTDRTDVTKYLIPIPAEASKVTVETSDPKVTLAQFIGVNGSGGSYTKVFSSAREAVYSYEFPKGVAQYMAIDLVYEDKGAVTVPWDYDAAATTTVTFT